MNSRIDALDYRVRDVDLNHPALAGEHVDGDLGASALAPSIALNRTSLGTVVTRGRSVVVPLAGKTEEHLFTRLSEPVASSSLPAVPVPHEDATLALLLLVAMGAYRVPFFF